MKRNVVYLDKLAHVQSTADIPLHKCAPGEDMLAYI